MVNFNYYTPTEVVFGKETQSQTGRLLKQYGAKKVLLHYGSSHAEKSGLLAEVKACAEAEGLELTLLGGVVPHPRLSLVRTGIALCREKGIDFILALGGGSVIDSAKAIALGAVYPGDVWDFYTGKANAEACLPLGCVLTISAAGSEMSSSSVITNEEENLKRGYNCDLTRCRFAVMNPQLTLTLPHYQTACGCVDIMMHTLERYFTPEMPMRITDEIAEGLLRVTIGAGQKLMRKPDNYSARAELMWAGSLSHNGLTGCGNGGGDWASHQISHEVSVMFGLAHGATLAAVWPSWARYVSGSPKNTNLQHTLQRFAQLGENVLDLPADEAPRMAASVIEEMESIFWGMEMPTGLPEADIWPTDAQIDEMARKCTRDGTRTTGGIMPLGQDDVRAILSMAAQAGQ